MSSPQRQALTASLAQMVSADLSQGRPLNQIMSSTVWHHCHSEAKRGMSAFDISTALVDLGKVFQAIPQLKSEIDQVASNYAAQSIGAAVQIMALAGVSPPVTVPSSPQPSASSAAVPQQLWEAQVSDHRIDTKEEFSTFLTDFSKRQLGGFGGVDNREIDVISDRAATWKKQGTGLAGRNPKLVSGVAKLAFYDFIFLCGTLGPSSIQVAFRGANRIVDNSWSMEGDNRMEALCATLEHTADIATKLAPENGISVRTLNSFPKPLFSRPKWDNLRSSTEIQKTMGRIKLAGGGSMLGTKLKTEVVEPLILEPARKNLMKRPVCVILITDGEVSSRIGTTKSLITQAVVGEYRGFNHSQKYNPALSR
jgi:hypothetical protein